MSQSKPFDPNHRVLSYYKNTGTWDKPVQRRRRKHKLGRLAAIEKRDGRVETKKRY